MDKDCDKGEGGGGDGLPEIPMEAWEMIERVKEIVSGHTDNEIYAMLLECEMDLNETVQRLLSLGAFEMVKGKRERRKKKTIAEAKRLQDIGSSSDFGDEGGSHHSENTSHRGESGQVAPPLACNIGDSADDEYKRQSIGMGDALSSAQSSQVLQPACSRTRGRASMADIVTMGRPDDEYKRQSIGMADAISSAQPSQVLQPACSRAWGRASMADIMRMGRPDDEYKRQSIGMGDAISSAQSSLVLQPACSRARGRASMADIVRMGRPGTRGHVSVADVEGMGRPGASTSSLPIMSTGTFPPLVGAVPEQDVVLCTPNLLSNVAENYITPFGTAPERSSFHVITPFVPPLGKAEPHQDLHSQSPSDTAEMSRDCQSDEVEASVSSEQLAELSAAATAGLEKPSMEEGEQPPGLLPAYTSLHELSHLQCELEEASGALLDDSSVGNLDFRNQENHGDEQPRIIPDADRENSASSCARERQWIVGPSLSSVAHAYSDSLPRSFLKPTEPSSRESEFSLQFPAAQLQFPAAQLQSPRYNIGGSHSSRPTSFMPEDVIHGTFSVSGLPSQALPRIHIAPETTLPRPFALDPDTQHSVSLEHFDSMLAGPSPPQSYASIPSTFQQAHTGEDSSHPILPELLQDILRYRNRTPVSHLAQPPAGYGNFGSATNIPPVGHQSFGNPTYIPPASHGSFGVPTHIRPTGHRSLGGPAYISPAGHGRFASATYIPPADYGSLGSPRNIPSRFLHNLPASMDLDGFLSSDEGAHFIPYQGGSSASWVQGPGGSRAVSPAAGSTHYYGLPEQNQQHPRDEGNQQLLQQHRSQGYSTPDGSQSWRPRGRWQPRHGRR